MNGSHEACHIYDLFLTLAGADPIAISAHSIVPNTDYWGRNDNFVATVSFADGSVASLTYTALGAASYPKERLDIFTDGKVLSLDDYVAAKDEASDKMLWTAPRAQKGHLEMLKALAECLGDGGAWPISLEDQLHATRIGLAVEEMIAPESDWRDRSTSD